MTSEKRDLRAPPPVEPLPPCAATCPAHTDVRGYVHAIARGNFEEAYRIAREPNPIPYICGKVCAHPCEDQCRRKDVDEPVAICALKRFVTERHDLGLGHAPGLSCAPPKDAKVAVVGSGPGGLTAAHDLARLGYRVTVFEAYPRLGGTMQVGIPLYRLPRETIDLEIAPLKELGIEFVTNMRVADVDGLFADGFKAVFLAVGSHVGARLRLPNADLPDVWLNTEFLRRVALGERIDLRHRKVLVLGGGNVAIDVARTAVRLGADRVSMAFLESDETMPAHPWEIEEAKEEGIEMFPGRTFKECVLDEGKVAGIKCVKVDFHGFKPDGAIDMEEFVDTEHILAADLIIFSIGQGPDLSFLPKDGSIAQTKRRAIQVDPVTLATTKAGVFAGGDAVTRVGFIIDAVAAGHRAARSIDAYLRGVDPQTVQPPDPAKLGTIQQKTLDHIRKLDREPLPKTDAALRRSTFDEVEHGYSETQAVRAALRCLTCGAGARVDPDKCIACLTCVRVCPFEVPGVDRGTAEVPVDYCQACGLCATECPAKAITMTLQSDEGVLRQVKLAIMRARSGGEPGIVGFACRYCAYSGESPEVVKAALPANVQVIDVLCSGKVDALYLLKAFEYGADGVFVAGCIVGECHNDKGNVHAGQRVAYVKKMLDDLGLNGARLEMFNTPPGECASLVEDVTRLASKVKELGASPVQPGRSN
ncbi:MAG TPA: hydrogenase iron-sulfur subunit [Anaerolineae bacterium]|nr:hydrogenase iron-sulfur subunit [Anaerolineae bacterium]HNT04987.1 hydrogenase iron-sulfur subunit [Anaerolineae bacterium]